MATLLLSLDMKVDGVPLDGSPTERRSSGGASQRFDYLAETDTAVSVVEIALGVVFHVDRPVAFTFDGVAATPTVPFFAAGGLYVGGDVQISMTGLRFDAISGSARVSGAAVGSRVV